MNEAEIGKGMLFYYFKSKKGLYFYLIDYVLDIIERKYLHLIDTSKQDLFDRLRNVLLIKIEFIKKYPHAMNFMAKILWKDSDYITEQTAAKITALQQTGYEKAYENIDFSLFRKDINPKKAIQIIRWTFDGYEAEIQRRIHDKNIAKLDLMPYWEEICEYLDVMKQSFYH